LCCRLFLLCPAVFSFAPLHAVLVFSIFLILPSSSFNYYQIRNSPLVAAVAATVPSGSTFLKEVAAVYRFSRFPFTLIFPLVRAHSFPVFPSLATIIAFIVRKIIFNPYHLIEDLHS
jgi:hypothetical protein